MTEEYPGQGFARTLRDLMPLPGDKPPVERPHHQTWPDRFWLSDEELLRWAAHEFEAYGGERCPKTPEEAIAWLSDAGLGRFIVKCPDCEGSGTVESYVYGPPPDGVPHEMTGPCETCGGSGEVER